MIKKLAGKNYDYTKLIRTTNYDVYGLEVNGVIELATYDHLPDEELIEVD